MKLSLTLEKMEEIVLCIVHNNLNEDEAVEYAKAVLLENNEAVTAREYIAKLEEDKKALINFFQEHAMPAFKLAIDDYPMSPTPAMTLKDATDLLLQVK